LRGGIVLPSFFEKNNMTQELPDGMLTEEQATDALDNLPMDDPEFSHLEGEIILCAFLRAEGYDDLAMAFIEARNRCGWWYN